MDFAKRVKQLREDRGWTQDQLAKMLDTSRSTVGDYETGRKMPKYDRLKQIADIFGTSVDFLLGYTDIKEPVEDLKQQIELNEPDIVDIMKNQKPHINGVPINEEQAEIFIEFLEAYYRRKLKEIEDEKNNQANKQ